MTTVNWKNAETHLPLGQKYKDKLTGFGGVATMLMFHQNGCISLGLSAVKKKKKSKKSFYNFNILRLVTGIEVTRKDIHPLLGKVAKHNRSGLMGTITHVIKHVEGHTHVWLQPFGQKDGEPHRHSEFDISEIKIGVRHAGVKINDPEVLLESVANDLHDQKVTEQLDDVTEMLATPGEGSEEVETKDLTFVPAALPEVEKTPEEIAAEKALAGDTVEPTPEPKPVEHKPSPSGPGFSVATKMD